MHNNYLHFQSDFVRHNPLIQWMIIFFLIFTTGGFRYKGWDPTHNGQSSYFLFLLIALYVLWQRKYLLRIRIPFKHEVIILTLLPLLCLITIILVNGESWYEERIHILHPLCFLIYFIYFISGTRESDILNAFTILGLAIFFIQIIQIIMPEWAIFGVDKNDRIIEVRNGIPRFRLETYFITILCLYYYWNKMCVKLSVRNIVLFSIFLCSLYLYLTRQLIFATLVTILCTRFFVNFSKVNIRVVCMTLVLAVGLFITFDSLLGTLVTKTVKELNTQNIRWIELDYYWGKIRETSFSFLFGSGHIVQYKEYANILMTSRDIGIIGEMYHYGFLWVLMYGYMLYLILWKYRKLLPLYIRMYVFGTSVNSLFIFPYRVGMEFMIWSSVLYIASLYIIHFQKQLIVNE